MYYPNKTRAFTILELLLVLTVAAGLLLLSFNRYQYYKEKLKVQSIRADVSLIFEALSYYYHSQSCTTVNGVPGTFPFVDQDLMSNMVLANYLATAELMMPAPVLHYQAMVVDSLQRNNAGNPIYEWQVIAVLSANVNLEAYAKLLDAQAVNPANSSLIWSLPANGNPIRANTPLWILNGNLMYFKNQQQLPVSGGCN